MGFFNVLGDAFNRANETKEEIKSLSAEQIAERTFSASSQMEKEMYIKALKQRVTSMDAKRAKVLKDYLDRNLYLQETNDAVRPFFQEKGIY